MIRRRMMTRRAMIDRVAAITKERFQDVWLDERKFNVCQQAIELLDDAGANDDATYILTTNNGTANLKVVGHQPTAEDVAAYLDEVGLDGDAEAIVSAGNLTKALNEVGVKMFKDVKSFLLDMCTLSLM